MEQLKVSTKSKPNAVAGAIAGIMKTAKSVEVHAVGAGAVNQAVKAIAIARGYLAPTGVDLICKPAFTTVKLENEDHTCIKFICEAK